MTCLNINIKNLDTNIINEGCSYRTTEAIGSNIIRITLI